MEVDGSGRTNARRWLRNGATTGRKGDGGGQGRKKIKKGREKERRERERARGGRINSKVGEREPLVMRFDPAVGKNEFGYLIRKREKRGSRESKGDV